MVDCLPEIDHVAVELHVYLVEMPTPTADAAHLANARPANVSREQWAKSVPPEAHSLVADVEASLGKQVLDVPQAEWVPYVHQHH